MKKTCVLLVEDHPFVRPTVSLALQSLGYTIVGAAPDRCETLRLLRKLTPDLVVISPSVLEKTGMGLVCEVLAKEHTAVFVIPGRPRDLFAWSLSLLRSADLGRLIAVIRVVWSQKLCSELTSAFRKRMRDKGPIERTASIWPQVMLIAEGSR